MTHYRESHSILSYVTDLFHFVLFSIVCTVLSGFVYVVVQDRIFSVLQLHGVSLCVHPPFSYPHHSLVHSWAASVSWQLAQALL